MGGGGCRTTSGRFMLLNRRSASAGLVGMQTLLLPLNNVVLHKELNAVL